MHRAGAAVGPAIEAASLSRESESGAARFQFQSPGSPQISLVESSRPSETLSSETIAAESTVPQNSTIDNEERLRLAAAAGQIGTWEWDPKEDVHIISAELCRIFGLDGSDPEGARLWGARVWPEDWVKVQFLMRQGSQSGEMEFEYRYIHPDFGLRWLYCKGRRFRDRQAMYGIVQDVTARKAAEEDSQRLVAIVASSDDAVVSKDLHGIVTSWNQAAERMFGYTSEEMIGRPITTIIPPDLRDDETRILSTIANGERIDHFETVRLKKSGEPVQVSLTVSPVKDESGRIIGAAKIARDITQRKKEERNLRTAERLAAVGRLAATVAHEINNPLEAVTNLVYLARMQSTSQEVTDFLASAEDELGRVGQIIRQTLGFYRETSGARRIRPSDLVTSVISVFAARARKKDIEIVPEFRADPWLNAVPGEIRQVLANLVSNSIDAIGRSGQIRIRVSSGRRWNGDGEPGIRITVADTGSGIAAEALRNLFEPFFTTKRDVGTGLGLWVCRNIVESHKGKIRARSTRRPRKSGTAFSMFLPQNLETQHAENESDHPEGWLLKTA
jgi:PAS domain S-box-containing protein